MEKDMLYKHYRKDPELTTLISDTVELRTTKIIKDKNGTLHMILKVSFLIRHDNPNSKLNRSRIKTLLLFKTDRTETDNEK